MHIPRSCFFCYDYAISVRRLDTGYPNFLSRGMTDRFPGASGVHDWTVCTTYYGLSGSRTFRRLAGLADLHFWRLAHHLPFPPLSFPSYSTGACGALHKSSNVFDRGGSTLWFRRPLFDYRLHSTTPGNCSFTRMIITRMIITSHLTASWTWPFRILAI